MLKTITCSSASPSLPLLFKFNKSSLPSTPSSLCRCLSFPFAKSSTNPSSSSRNHSVLKLKNPMNNLLGKLGLGFASRTPETSLDSSAIAQGPDDELPAPGQQFAQFGAGCFWGVELAFQRVPGVTRTEVGYSQGFTHNPTYEDICTGMTNHSEVVRVQYDPKQCAFENLLDVFWDRHDPTTLNRQL
ncbi:Peptide methionine sulfoxide reductase A4 chloroplastic [Bienertia sinuspersici]